MTTHKLGILGGMGPLASLAFIRTIYECNPAATTDQEYPDILLHSLASVPDRTRTLLDDAETALANTLTQHLRTLQACGATKLVICCLTSHAVIHRLPPDLRSRLISLVDLTAQELTTHKKRGLLLASRGSYQRGVFRCTQQIRAAEEYIVLPDEKDQAVIHDLIYRSLKTGGDIAPVYDAVVALLDRYRVDSFIAGCTEFHLLSRYIQGGRNGGSGIGFVDPLFCVAWGMPKIMGASGPDEGFDFVAQRDEEADVLVDSL